MSIISIASQKGGVAKTTTLINLGAGLQKKGKSVLLIDADPQGSMTEALGILEEQEKNLFTELSKEIRGENSNLSDAIITTASGLQLVPSSLELAWAELELVSVYGREQIFTWMLDKLETKYDFILFDCPPSVGLLTVNALVSSDYILMPIQAEFLPQKAVRIFMHHLKTIKKLNKDLELLGIVLTKYDHHKTMNRDIRQKLQDEFGNKLFHTTIRNNIQLAKAQQAGLDIFNYNKRSNGAEDYEDLTNEFLVKMKAG
ncbi:MAG: ParA family protein [Saprospiraceae bacterium]|uniref:ParA family protein n=1 Tax=Candidatus Opimibacter skivensis TaxID=2982028 RepID=A0A9D7SVC7_9BACT|nr:ParA family protein [Candidatus Opimibacter skivensis]